MIVDNLMLYLICEVSKDFFARRGLPQKFIFDSDKTFKTAARTIMVNQDVRQHLSNVGVKLNFKLEMAPWWGGILERSDLPIVFKKNWPIQTYI